MAQLFSEALIIKAKNYGEADRIFTILTKKFGKMRVVAKGVRKISSKRAGNVDLLNYVQIGFVQTHGLPILTEASVINSFENLKKDLNWSVYGYALLEILDKLLEDDEENAEVFDLAVQTLKKLTDSGNNKDLHFSYFEYGVLSLLGYDPILDFCALCLRDFDASWEKVKFSGALGGIVCDKCEKGGLEVSWGGMELLGMFRSRRLGDKKEGSTNSESIREITEVLKYYIEYILEAPIRSLRVFSRA